jgi:hypothetical protein
MRQTKSKTKSSIIPCCMRDPTGHTSRKDVRMRVPSRTATLDGVQYDSRQVEVTHVVGS